MILSAGYYDEIMDCTKLERLGWKSKHHLETGIPRTIQYLKQEWEDDHE